MSAGREVLVCSVVHWEYFPVSEGNRWQMDNAASGALMTAFYRNWREQGMDKAAALQAAQAEVANQSQWHSPFFWAGFVLHGDTGIAQHAR